MKIIIIDDEPSAIDALKQALGKYEDAEIVGTATNGIKGITLMRTKSPDLLFLDVELPDMSGIEFLSQMDNLAKNRCHVVVYTAHSHYMLPAFRERAFDFLLKPVDERELGKVMQRYLMEENEALMTPVRKSKDSERVILYTNATDFRVVDMRDVGMFQYNHDQRAWEAVMAGKEEPVRLKRTITNETLTDMDARFIQISQRNIINIHYLLEVNDGECRFYPPFEHITGVKVGRQYRRQFVERFSTL